MSASAAGGGASKMLKFFIKVYVMGKGLSGKLSCTPTGLVETELTLKIEFVSAIIFLLELTLIEKGQEKVDLL